MTTQSTIFSNKQEYLDLVRQAGVVSFDVFDTLLIRKVARPIDVFRIVQEHFNQNSAYTMTVDFAELRSQAERRAYKEVDPNASLLQIYQLIKQETGFSEVYIAALMQAEMEVELLLLKTNGQGKALYDEALAAGKKVVILSDMYLPSQFIAKALRQNGFERWDELVVSTEAGVAKHDGSAYAQLFTDNAQQRIVHVGDNLHSDINWAKAFGIATIHLEQNLLRMSYEQTDASQTAQSGMLLRSSDKASYSIDDTQQSLMTGLIVDKVASGAITAHAETIGYAVLGPLLLGYVQWLHAKARADGIEHLYFLARDGAIMQRAYKQYYGQQAIDSTYLLASRRLYNLPKINNNYTLHDIIFLTSTDYPLRVRDYLDRVAMDTTDSQTLAVLSQLRLEPDTLIDSEALQQAMRAAFMLLMDKVNQVAAGERERLLAYLKANGLTPGMQGRLAVIDVGWNGSLQRSLDSLLDRRFKGYYFGIHDNDTTRLAADSMTAYIDERKGLDTDGHALVRKAIEVVELFFTNPDQDSVIGLEKQGRHFEPLTLAEGRDEEMLNNLRQMQAAAVTFVSDFRQSLDHLPEAVKNISFKVASRNVVNMIRHPNDGAALVIGRAVHSHSLGVPPRPIGSPLHDKTYYRRHPAELEREYQLAYWKQGFIKNEVYKDIHVQHIDD